MRAADVQRNNSSAPGVIHRPSKHLSRTARDPNLKNIWQQGFSGSYTERHNDQGEVGIYTDYLKEVPKPKAVLPGNKLMNMLGNATKTGMIRALGENEK